METILIVEDNPRMQETLSTVLRLKGFQTLTAYNGVEALDVLRLRTPDLVLLDLMMPVMSGLDLLKVLRESPRWNDLPVVVLSARDDFAAELRELGVTDYLVKSRYSVNDLLHHIRKNMRRVAVA